MNHVLVFKTANHVSNGVSLTDVGEKLVAQAFTLGCAGDKTRNVDKFHGGRNDALGFDDGGKLVLAWVWYGNRAFIGLDGTEWEVLGRDAIFGQGVE